MRSSCPGNLILQSEFESEFLLLSQTVHFSHETLTVPPTVSLAVGAHVPSEQLLGAECVRRRLRVGPRPQVGALGGGTFGR